MYTIETLFEQCGDTGFHVLTRIMSRLARFPLFGLAPQLPIGFGTNSKITRKEEDMFEAMALQRDRATQTTDWYKPILVVVYDANVLSVDYCIGGGTGWSMTCAQHVGNCVLIAARPTLSIW